MTCELCDYVSKNQVVLIWHKSHCHPPLSPLKHTAPILGFNKCGRKRCCLCDHVQEGDTAVDMIDGTQWQITGSYICTSMDVIYLLGHLCQVFYSVCWTGKYSLSSVYLRVWDHSDSRGESLWSAFITAHFLGICLRRIKW